VTDSALLHRYVHMRDFSVPKWRYPALQNLPNEGNAKCLLPPAFVTRSGTTPSLLTRTEQYSTLEESVHYSKCVLPAFYRGGHAKGFFSLDTPWCPRGLFPVTAGWGMSPSPLPRAQRYPTGSNPAAHKKIPIISPSPSPLTFSGLRSLVEANSSIQNCCVEESLPDTGVQKQHRFVLQLPSVLYSLL
jgi:hypothetical protein